MTKTQKRLMIGGGIVGGGLLLWYLCKKYCWFSFCCKGGSSEEMLPQGAAGYEGYGSAESMLPDGIANSTTYESEGQVGDSLPATGESRTTTSALNRARKRMQPGQRTVKTSAVVRSPSAVRRSASPSRLAASTPGTCPAGTYWDPARGGCLVYVE